MKSFVGKDPGQAREWRIVDAAGVPLGRLAVKVANALRGKDKATFTPHVDTGCSVVVINAAQVKMTGRKEDTKTYHRYSGWRSGLKIIPAADMRAKHPERLILLAVKGMLPNNKLSRKMFRRLKVYAGAEHPHAAQNPCQMAGC
jgi:large subunit ribosomal protein L13